MNSWITDDISAAPQAEMTRRRRERLFYTGKSVAFTITVFAGFARTYYLRPYFGAPPLRPLLHLHGIVFSSWLVLLLAQTTLIAAKRTSVHRRLGIAGGALAVLMVMVGTATAVIRAQEGSAASDGSQALTFLVIPLGDMLLFSSLVAAGLYYRRRADTHKRLMLLATIAILPAATARLPFDFLKSGPAFFVLADLFLMPCFVYDLITRRRVHSATAWGALAIVASQPIRLAIGDTRWWLEFAIWLTHQAA